MAGGRGERRDQIQSPQNMAAIMAVDRAEILTTGGGWSIVPSDCQTKTARNVWTTASIASQRETRRACVSSSAERRAALCALRWYISSARRERSEDGGLVAVLKKDPLRCGRLLVYWLAGTRTQERRHERNG